MANNKLNQLERSINPKKCPTKHKRAYKTSFGAYFCPDCGYNIKK